MAGQHYIIHTARTELHSIQFLRRRTVSILIFVRAYFAVIDPKSVLRPFRGGEITVLSSTAKSRQPTLIFKPFTFSHYIVKLYYYNVLLIYNSLYTSHV